VADLYRLLPEVDGVVVDDARASHAGLAGRARLAAELAGLGFERAVCLPTSFDSAWTLFRARIPERIGYAGEWRRLLLTRALSKPDRPGEHQVWKHLRLAEAAGAALPARLDASLPVSEAAVSRARVLLAEAGGSGGPFLAAHVASFAHAAKRWELKRFAEVFDALAEERGLETVLLGTASETAMNAEAAALAKRARVLDLSGKSTLPEALGVLRLARAFLGNDSGVAHLAAAAGTPAAVVFGPTDPGATRPLESGAPVVVVRVPVVCAPCRYRVCPIDHRCMRDVTVASVSATLSQLTQVTSKPHVGADLP
jgi:lipopolysaccharide heptosyltransferase II